LGPGISERFSSRGAAFGDYDNDGDIDALILNMSDVPSLLRNDGGNLQNWIKVKLIGTKCNRTAIGARVRVVTGNHAQMDEVHSGGSVMSQSDLRLHFGLGKAQVVDALEVKWPTTQKVERFTQVKANQIPPSAKAAELLTRSSQTQVAEFSAVDQFEFLDAAQQGKAPRASSGRPVHPMRKSIAPRRFMCMALLRHS